MNGNGDGTELLWYILAGIVVGLIYKYTKKR